MTAELIGVGLIIADLTGVALAIVEPIWIGSTISEQIEFSYEYFIILKQSSKNVAFRLFEVI
jgi:hypothetical protein